MSAHYYPMLLAPRSCSGVDPSEDSAWDEQPAETLLCELRALLPNDASRGWTEKFLAGTEWSSELIIQHRDSRIHSILFRFAPIFDDLKLLERFLEIASRHGLRIWSVISSRWITPELDSILSDMQGTLALEFLWNPRGATLEAAAKAKRNKPE